MQPKSPVKDLSLSARANEIQTSATMAVSARANELQAQGKNILNFSAGEPDFQPPKPVIDAVCEFVLKKPVLYSPIHGLAQLREIVAAELNQFHGQSFTAKNILVSSGAKQSLANVFLATLDPGDQVIIPAPYWVSYPEMVRLAQGDPKIVPTSVDHGWRLQPETLAAALSPKTKFLLLNSPSNPTGAGYSEKDFRVLGEVLAKKAPQAWILCDDIYRQLVYDGFEQASIFRALDGVTEQILVVDGVSKSHAMTGFRIGFLAAPPQIIAAAAKIQSQVTSGAATPSQIGAIAALAEAESKQAVLAMRGKFAQRRALMLQGIATIPNTQTHPPEGAFYLFTNISAYVGPHTAFASDLEFATWLLEQKLVATVPGTAFGAPNHLRISYATDENSLQEGVRRLQDAFASLPASSAPIH